MEIETKLIDYRFDRISFSFFSFCVNKRRPLIVNRDTTARQALAAGLSKNYRVARLPWNIESVSAS